MGHVLCFCKIHTFLLVPEQYTWKIHSPPEWDSFSPENPISCERECVYIVLILLGETSRHMETFFAILTTGFYVVQSDFVVKSGWMWLKVVYVVKCGSKWSYVVKID